MNAAEVVEKVLALIDDNMPLYPPSDEDLTRSQISCFDGSHEDLQALAVCEALGNVREVVAVMVASCSRCDGSGRLCQCSDPEWCKSPCPRCEGTGRVVTP